MKIFRSHDREAAVFEVPLLEQKISKLPQLEHAIRMTMEADVGEPKLHSAR